jgi:hypothetical protein
VEQYAQQQLDTLKNPHARKGSYGFDIAMDRAGKHNLIETNPATNDGASAFISKDPTVSDSIYAAASGELPMHVKARRAVWGTGGVLGLGAGANALTNNKPEDNMKTAEEAYIEGFLKQATAHGYGEEAAVKLLKSAGAIPAKLLGQYTSAMNRGMRGLGTTVGGLGGGTLGGLVGGVNGLASSSNNPEDGFGSRLMRGVAGAGKGALIGGTAGAGLGLGVGQGLRSLNNDAIRAAAKLTLSKKVPKFNNKPRPELRTAARAQFGLKPNKSGISSPEKLKRRMAAVVHVDGQTSYLDTLKNLAGLA